ncbi:MAG: restriction endonuclease [Bacteroidales bacterium]|nr:restriction endonuclease [Lachnoclostridium sp.]MCM1385487.1 restriction endonuclease [Lachnoclostridium sp.]MCM1466211.1 restriction endonuclease [Bacteroidales bacterium]
MSFYDLQHQQRIAKIESLWSSLHDLSELAKSYGIDDIFQDNGAKVLQQLIYLNFKSLPGREGNDALSASGTEWEMKSINLETSASGFSTNHHTNHDIIAKYRQVPWTFAIYHDITLSEMYVMTPKMLEPIYAHWEEKLKTCSHLNNPKIPVSFVRENGIQVYPINKHNAIDPDSLINNL